MAQEKDAQGFEPMTSLCDSIRPSLTSFDEGTKGIPTLFLDLHEDWLEPTTTSMQSINQGTSCRQLSA